MRPLVWFRADLRTRDNTALHEACAAATRGVLAVFTICPVQWRMHDWGDPRASLVQRSLAALSKDLLDRNIALKLITRDRFRGVEEDLLKLAREHQCTALYYNSEYEVNEQDRDHRVNAAFNDAKLPVHAFHDQTVVPPDALRTGEDKPYTVYSPYKRRWYEYYNAGKAPTARGLPKKQPEFVTTPDPIPERIGDFDPHAGHAGLWKAGQAHALSRLQAFIQHKIEAYKEERDFPAIDGTSVLSPYLAVGAISPRQCIEAAVEANRGRLDTGSKGPVHWMSEVIWREFYRQILVAFPRVCKHQPFNPRYDIPWRSDARARADFDAWKTGNTGYPIIDAAMRQLITTGWMHNRVRMAVAMFLTKDLLIDWRWGERYFMQRLVDADLANNNGGWQWSAATGTDAAPYFRIFNPITQSRKFDPDGRYIRRFIPELASLDDQIIHEPWRHASLFDAIDYPKPIVDHSFARERALAAFKVHA